MISLILAVGFLLYVYRPSAHAQIDPPSEELAKKRFGHYSELNLDMEVKVQSGRIRIYRSWDGDKKSWSINPQQEDLELSEETEGEAYGQALAKEISRGPRKFKNSGTSWLKAGGGGGGGGGGTAAPSPASIAVILGNQIDYCTNEGEKQVEALRVGKDGIKWVTGIGRQWAQFDPEGALQSWGLGNYRIGQMLRDANNKPRGYADTFDNEVITITRDGQDRITKITDDGGREVQYTYNTEGLISGLISDFIDTEGVTTHYEYNNGNIVNKKIGDATGAPPGEEINEQTGITINYHSGDGELKSIQTLDGTQVAYQYEYNQEDKLYITTEYASGNRTTRTIRKVDDGVISVDRNGEYQLRIDHLCEDTAIIDKHNRITYIDRDALGYIRQVIFPDQRKMAFEHSTANWPEVGDSWNGATAPWGIIKLITPSGRVVNYERDEFGQMRKAIEFLEGGGVRYWSFTYDTAGNLTEQRLQASATPNDALDHVTRWKYDLRGNIAEYNVGLGHPPWKYEYNSRGDITKVISPDGKTWLYTYTGLGKLKSALDPVGYKIVNEYTKRGLLRRTRETYAIGQEAVTDYLYNHRGLVTKIKDPLGNFWSYEYDGAGELTIATDPEGKKAQYQYDPRGRMKSLTDGNGITINYDYFDTAPVGQAPQTSFAFAPRVHIKYPTYTAELQYDLSDRLLFQVMRPSSGPNAGPAEQTSFEYDGDNRLNKITRPDGQALTYSWDDLGRMTAMSAPGQGSTSIEYPTNTDDINYHDAVGGTVSYKFDHRGLLASETRADGSQLQYDYDLNGNLAGIIDPKGQAANLIYDDALRLQRITLFAQFGQRTPVRTIDYTRNLRGDLLSVDDGEVTQSYEHDPLGRITLASTSYGTEQAGPELTKSHSYTYTPNGNVASYTAVDGKSYSYLWDNADNFSGIIIPGEGTLSLGYDSVNGSQPTQIQFPGGIKQLFEYTDLRQLKNIHSVDQPGNTVMNREYSFISGPVEGAAISGITTEHGNYAYSYDAAYRIKDATLGSGSEEHYTYDAIGRRQPAAAQPWTYNNQGAVTDTGEAQFTYDANGNRKTQTDASGTTSFFYDESDRLVRVEKPAGSVVAKYKYDFTGRRLWKEIAGVKTYFYYNEDGLAAEFDSAGNVTKSYLFAPGSEWTTGPLALKEGNTYHYVLGDHLGTPQKLIKKTGQVTWDATYDLFGKASVGTQTVSNPLRFPGQYADPESGLYQNFQRNYDPMLGAYAEQDPFGVMITGANRYGYAGGNPVGIYDPTGEIVPVIAVGLAILFAVDVAWTGFELYECFKAAQDNCLNPLFLESCQNAVIGAVLPFGVGKVAKVGRRVVPFSRILNFTERQLQKKFNHAKEFGISGNYNRANAAKFNSAINQHINSPNIKIVEGTYRNNEVIHHINPSTNLNVMSDHANSFISGWRLNPSQLNNVLSNGKLGGG